MLTPQGFQVTTDTSIRPPEVQLIPHSIEAEHALLGALLIDPDQMMEINDLKAEDFYLIGHRCLYAAMLELFQRHGGYDVITLNEQLESMDHLADIGGPGALADIMSATPTSYGAPEYAATVYRHSISRQVIVRAIKATQAAYKNVTNRTGDMLVSEVVQSFSEIDATRNVSNGPQPIAEGVNKLFDEMERADNGYVSGLQTGIKTLDYILGGFGEKKLYLLAGRPGMGKSALALQIALNVAKEGVPVLLFALEMSTKNATARLVASLCGIPYESFKRGGGDQWDKILEAGERVSRLPIIIEDTPALTVSNIKSISQKVMIKHPIGLIIADHVGITRPERETGNIYQESSRTADQFMSLPKQLDCPVLALSQLSRKVENRTDKRPGMRDLRDSGKWEENADGILFLYRDEVYNKETDYPHLAEINVGKNRGGKTGPATVYANVATNQFVDLDTRSIDLNRM